MVKLSNIANKNPRIIYIVTIGVLVVAIGSAVFFYTQNRKNNTSNKIALSDVEKTAEAVAKLMELPQETPTLATVSDVTKLKDQPFFLNANNGDKVLIFKTARKAILYRPFTNKIIEVGPIQLEEPSVAGTATESAQAVSPSPTIGEKVYVAVYNGTKTAGLSKKTADRLKGEFPSIEIDRVGNAKEDYTKTVVVDVSKKNKSMAESIAKFLKGDVGSMPKGEATPEADILVLVSSE